MIKVRDLAYVRLSAPDLDAMQKFLTDFGLVVTHRGDDALYARGTDPSPYVHVTERGAPAFVGLAFEAVGADDLAAAAGLAGASAVEKIDAPGGGRRVRFTDPDGHAVEVVHGRERLAPLPVRSAAPLNRGSARVRFGAFQRLAAGPSSVKRLGHAGLHVTDFRRSEAWYKSRFGFLSSDEVYLGQKESVLAAFLRCVRGDEHVDHHTLVLIGDGRTDLDHVAFEVEDFDAVMLGHEHLEKAGYQHRMGVGRHVLGSQIFDYWNDPWGHMHEHFTDGDLLDAGVPTGSHDPGTALANQWGTPRAPA
jgi:catechol 2,3-dioxygenase-like lactoylglutathione lyase family enzyme